MLASHALSMDALVAKFEIDTAQNGPPKSGGGDTKNNCRLEFVILLLRRRTSTVDGAFHKLELLGISQLTGSDKMAWQVATLIGSMPSVTAIPPDSSTLKKLHVNEYSKQY